MKKLNFLVLAALVSVGAMTACDNPKQRPEVINKDIQGKLVAIADLHDVTTETTKAYFYQETTQDQIQKLDKTSQIKIDDNVMKVLSFVKSKDAKDALDAQLKSGLITFIVLPDQVKIYKALTKTDLANEKKSNSAQSMTQLKQIKKISLDTMAVSAASIDLTEAKSDIEYVEIASISIEKTGVLENQKTKYYDEKMSVLNIAERPFDLSTHLLLKEEILATPTTEKPTTP